MRKGLFISVDGPNGAGKNNIYSYTGGKFKRQL